MARVRVCYLLGLIGASAFFLFFHDYFSFYLLILALVFPFFVLAVSLPGMRGEAGFVASAHGVRRGEKAVLRLTYKGRRGFPVGRVSARFQCVNLLTGEEISFRKKALGGGVLEAEVPAKHCGLLRCGVSRVKVCDLLGLFSFSLPAPDVLSILSLPLDLPPESVPSLLGEGEGQPVMRPRPGGGPGEDYELRPYRAGDPLRAVHWKLSSKLDELVVREVLEPVPVQIVLTYDHFGTPEELDLVFDRLSAVSRALIESERLHAIRWVDPATGAECSKIISSQNDLWAFAYEAFAMKAPTVGHPVGTHSVRPPLTRYLHMEKGGEAL